jgi:hypothetical protein
MAGGHRGSALNGTSVRLCCIEEPCFGGGSRLVQIDLFLGSSFHCTRLDSIRTIIDAMGGHGTQDSRIQLVSSLGTRPARGGENDQRLQRPFEADVTGTNPDRCRGLGHERAVVIRGHNIMALS